MSLPKKLYRLSVRADEQLTWVGTVTAEKRDGKWIFSGLTGAVDSGLLNHQTVPQSALPAECVILDGEKENQLTELIRQQKALIEEIKAAEARMEARLKREHQFLLQTIQSTSAWKVTLPVQNGPPRQLMARFVHQENQGEKVFLLVEDAADPRQRGVWVGALNLIETAGDGLSMTADRPHPFDGWVVTLVPSNSDGWIPREAGTKDIRLALAGQNELTWANHKSLVKWVPEPSVTPLPDAETFRRQVLASITPGQAWEGTIHYKGATAEQLRLTFTEFTEESHLVRLIVESPSDPFAIAVFEGTAALGFGEIHGWPLLLKNTSARQRRGGAELPLFETVAGRTKLWLTLAPDGTLLGTSRSTSGDANELTFKLADRIDPLQPAAVRWQTALTAGSRWVGSIASGNQPSEKLTLIVNEVLEGGRILWLTAEDPDNPHRHRAFQATLDSSRGIIDGYALSLEPRSIVGQPTDYDSLGRRHAVFGAPDGLAAAKLVRLTLDGKKLMGVPGAGQTFSVDRQDAPVEQPLDLASRTELWKKACTTGTRWSGIMHSKAAGQTVEVMLLTTSGVDEVGNVSFNISLTRQRNLHMPLTGTLNIDHSHANSFALTLRKQIAGKGNSRIFGPDTAGITVHFRMSNDAQQLFGMTSSPGRYNDEFLILKRED